MCAHQRAVVCVHVEAKVHVPNGLQGMKPQRSSELLELLRAYGCVHLCVYVCEGRG